MLTLARRIRALILDAAGVSSRAQVEDAVIRLRAIRVEMRRVAVRQKELLTLSRKHERRIARLAAANRQLVERLGNSRRGIGRQLRRHEQNIQAVLRRLVLDKPQSLTDYLLTGRFGILSQDEEDGITFALFELAGVGDRRFIDLGSGTNGGNCGFLARDCGWSGMMVDASDRRVGKLKKRFESPSVVAVQCWITKENVNGLVAQRGFTGEIDLLSIDLDGNDYWVWDSLDAVTPRVVIVEFNAAFGVNRAVVVPYDPMFDRHRYRERCPYYHGSSLTALRRLAARKGYRLVVVEPNNINAYFVRNDVAPELPEYSVTDGGRTNTRAPGQSSHGQASVYRTLEEEDLPLVDFDVGHEASTGP